MSKESFPKPNLEPEKSGEMGKILRKLALPVSLLFGAGFAAEKKLEHPFTPNNVVEIAGRNPAEKAETGGTPENFAVKIESADTVKSNGNMSPESVPGFVPDKIVEKKLENPKISGSERFKVHKSGPDTHKSD